MKKLFVTLSLVAGALAANAQDGMPVKGDYSLGIDATPFLTYFGGLLSNAGATAPTFNNPTNPMTITGKYFTADNRAVRMSLGLGATTSTVETVNAEDATKFDELKSNAFGLAVNAGYEYRRTKGKLVGVYGPSVGLGIQTQSTEFTDAVTTADNQNVKTTGGSTFNFNVGGFVGAEYFFTKNISVSGEFGLGLGLTDTSKTEVERPNVPTVTSIGKSSSFGVSINEVYNGNLGLNLYF